MSKKASQFQKKVMSLGYRGKEIFKPLNTGWIDEHTACIREWIANIFFYTKNGTTIMIDAGYNYDRLEEKMRWLVSIRLLFSTSWLLIRIQTMSGLWNATQMGFSGMQQFT